ncbi:MULTISPECIES: alanine dehydrogenase [Exiguobacterium]|jgi:alanine dehydrogenase|uniref:Alanine dehydrogenase n=1 Tax=Exiguobacterium sp. (strain ATCC BAA-1283 / AT1b) TaxID=360911 RepID=C4L0Y8_EXISA|nr:MULTISPECIES: alanine dehydrogenase [Exiguobacterium]MCC9625144.1 alanine dehydrogenase [Thalassospira sp. MA62]QPI67461.1 alanine dehydrogenase [Exiguobacterium sp. PBE]ACQ70951.1 alanine dehydrogenase [Exiguobacterium sp. AT1b]MBG0916342.1 alanine dehydrogenase [Exiguobacterium sp. SRB7LM]MCV9900649.1 alanine dehydrogenase [Exiguobacterium sp. N5]
MKIGVLKEIKNNENRVALTPMGAFMLTELGHDVFVETNAGLGSGFTNMEYIDAGATILETAKEVWEGVELALKVKEPQPSEYQYFRPDLTLFTYLHLAAEPELTKALVDSGITAIAYETVEVDRTLPLLTPMSEVAGRMAAQIGAQILEKPHGGKGILMSGLPGVPRANVTVIGGGVVGTNAARIAIGLGASVTLMDISPARLRQIDDLFGNTINTLISNKYNIAKQVAESDLVIGAVLIPGAKAPKLVTEEMVQRMSPGSVIVDVAIDQGGICETIDHITTHDAPTYERYGVQHYAVANMPGAVPRTSTMGLTNATMPYIIECAQKGVFPALLENEALLKGLNVINGTVTYEAVARDLEYPFVPAHEAVSKQTQA